MKVVAVSIIAGLLGLPPGSAVAQTQPAAMVNFDIPAQPVSSALRAYAHQAKVQLLVLTEGLEAIRVNTVVGSYEPTDALSVLLEGTGLFAEHGTDSTVMIRRKQLASQDVTPLNPGRPFLPVNEPADGAHIAGEFLAEPPNDEDPREELESIVVTGSRIRGAQTAAPVITVTREEIDQAGFATVEQLIDSWPQNFSGGANQENFNVGGQSVRQATGSEVSIDLRGLGSDATLVLVNGRRMAAGGLVGGFSDVSSIPITAIDRVEILTDGASAIYGADAVGGVVNFILLNEYEGAETRLQSGPDVGTDTSHVRFGQLFGKSWSSGNLLFSYEYFEQDNLDTADRPQAADGDLTSFGGDNFNLLGGNPGTIVVAGETFAIPEGQDGTALAASDFAAGTRNLRNRREGLDLRGAQERHSVFMTLRSELSDTAEFFLDSRFTKNEISTRTFSSPVDLNVPDTNPFFVDPTGSGLAAVRIEDYSFVPDLGPVNTRGDTETFGGSLGAAFDLGSTSSWETELSGTYAREKSLNMRGNFPNVIAVAAALAQETPDRAFNPFADGSNTHPDVLETIRACCNSTQVITDFWSLNADLSGRPIDFRGIPIHLAAGVEHRQESINGTTTEGAGTGSIAHIPGIDRRRKVDAAYLELFAPLVEQASGRPWLQRLDFSVAGRYVNYSDFGNNTSPKFGILWSPSNAISVRGTIGKSFKPPLLSDLDTSDERENLDSYLGFTPIPAIFRFGGNENLTPEEALTWTAGIQLSPKSLSGLHVDLTYFDIEFKDRILVIQAGLFGVFDPEFAPLVTLNPSEEEVIEIASSPRYRNFGTSAADIISGAAPVRAIVDFRRQNFARWQVSGLDFKAAYGFDTRAGRVDLKFNGSYFMNLEQALLSTLPSESILNTVGSPVDLRMRGGLSWTKRNWSASGFVNYTDDYTDDDSDPARPVGSWTTADLQVSYDTMESMPTDWLDELRVSLSIQNLFDEYPPFVNRSDGLGFDPANASIFGRAVYIQLVKSWY